MRISTAANVYSQAVTRSGDAQAVMRARHRQHGGGSAAVRAHGATRISESRVQTTALCRVHPLVSLVYLMGMLLLCLFCRDPVGALVLFGGVLTSVGAICGGHSLRMQLIWLMPLILLMTIANGLFVSSGQTELMRIGHQAIYAESLMCGLARGLLLATLILSFKLVSGAGAADGMCKLLGIPFPTLGAVVSLVLGLVPRMIRRFGELEGFQRLHLKGTATSWRCRLRNQGQLFTQLMASSMEESLIMADSMEARGWGCGPRKPSGYPLRGRDKVGLTVVLIMGGGALFAVLALSGSSPVSESLSVSVLGSYAAPGFWFAWCMIGLYGLLPFLIEFDRGIRERVGGVCPVDEGAQVRALVRAGRPQG